MTEQQPPDENARKEFVLPENDPSKGIFPESIGNFLRLAKDAVMEDPNLNWDTYDKSVKGWTLAAKKAGAIVFGYVDGQGKFIAADSEEDAHKIFEDTGDLLCLSYNPRPITIGVRVKGYKPGGLILEPESPST